MGDSHHQGVGQRRPDLGRQLSRSRGPTRGAEQQEEPCGQAEGAGLEGEVGG